jgi:hypothetical protein
MGRVEWGNREFHTPQNATGVARPLLTLCLAPAYRRYTMQKILLLTTALFIGSAVSTAEPAVAAGTRSSRAQCEHQATLQLYIGQQRTRWIRQCEARGGASSGKALARRPVVHAAGPSATRMAPLGNGNPPSTFTGSTSPSNAPVAPSSPVVGSSGNSTTGSTANSTAGSSGSTLGGATSGRSTTGSGTSGGSLGSGGSSSSGGSSGSGM